MWKKFICGYEEIESNGETKIVPKNIWINILKIKGIQPSVDVDYQENDDGDEIRVEKPTVNVYIGTWVVLYEIKVDDILKLVQNIPKNIPLIDGEKYAS